MGNLIIQALFSIISNIANFIIQPFINAIVILLPDIVAPIAYINTFFSLAFTYLATILRWFLFTPPMFILLFGYFFTKFTIWLTSCSIRFVLKIYNAVKP